MEKTSINNLKNSDFRNLVDFNNKKEPNLDDLLNKCQDLYEGKKKNAKSNFRISRNDNGKSPLFMKAAAALVIGGVITAGIIGMNHKTEVNVNDTVVSQVSQESKYDFSSFLKIKEAIEKTFSSIPDNLENKEEVKTPQVVQKEISKKILSEQHKLGSYIGLSDDQKNQNSVNKAVTKYLEITNDSLKKDSSFVDTIVKYHFSYLKKYGEMSSLSSKIEMDSGVDLHIQSQKMKDSKDYFHGLYSDGKLFAVIDKDSLKYTKYSETLENNNKKVSTWKNPDVSPVDNSRKL